MTTITTTMNGAVEMPSVANEAERERLEKELSGEKKASWFTRLVTSYLRSYAKRRAAAPATAPSGTQTARAERACRNASLKSALTGAASGAAATGAAVITASTEGVGGLVAVPVAVAGMAGEMLYRAVIHVELTCELAEIFDVHIDPDDPKSVWRLYALAFGTEEHEEGSEDPGKGLVERVLDVESDQVGEEIGSALVGESLMRNLLPFVGIATSSITNYVKTRKLGETMRRYFRYRRALEDMLERAETRCHGYLDLLIEGVWFVFTADGRLTAEEAGVLAWMLRRFSEAEQNAISARFVEDELEWTERIHAIPVEQRADFFQALEVAATVDKSVSLPERKLLRRVAKELGVSFDMHRLEQMMRRFEEIGVLADVV